MTHGDYNYKPKWSESNRGCELRYLDVPLAVAVTKQLKGAPGLSERAVDPFQNAAPCWQRTDSNNPCSGGCGKVRSVVTTEDAGKQWLCFDCRSARKHTLDTTGLVFPPHPPALQEAIEREERKANTIELFNLGGTILVPTFGDTTGVHNQIIALQRFAVAAPCWMHLPYRWTQEVVEVKSNGAI